MKIVIPVEEKADNGLEDRRAQSLRGLNSGPRRKVAWDESEELFEYLLL